jgi:hypothetical protein
MKRHTEQCARSAWRFILGGIWDYSRAIIDFHEEAVTGL